MNNGHIKVAGIKCFRLFIIISLLFSNLSLCRKSDGPIVLNANPQSDHSFFVVENHKYKDAEFWVYYPTYFYSVEMVIYDDHIIWDSESHERHSFCCAILNYNYKYKNSLFSNIVTVTKSRFPCTKISCPDLQDSLENAFYLLNSLHQQLDTELQESLESGEQPGSSTDYYQQSEVPTNPYETAPTIVTGETSVSTEENNLSHPVSNSDQSQSETQDQTEIQITLLIEPV